MEDLAKIATQVISKMTDSLPVPSRPQSGPPALFDRETDFNIPSRVWGAWQPEGCPRELHRELMPSERSALSLRANDLLAALAPFERGDNTVDVALNGMLGGFRSMRQTGANADGIMLVLHSVLREFPAWAIREASRRIACNQAGFDPRWPPNDAQIYSLVASIVKPYRETLNKITDVLRAPVEQRSKRVA